MPITIPQNLPAQGILERENIFIMDEQRAMHQDIRPLKIALLNLMPTKIETETQFLRLLSNSPLQLDLTLLHTQTHKAANISSDHLMKFYRTYDEVREERFDGMIITGAPVELLDFEEVDYWPELTQFMDWSLSHVYSTMHICWGAQAALHYHYGVPKYPLSAKMFGVFQHELATKEHNKLLRGFDDLFFAPHSRHTEVKKEDLLTHPELEILAESPEAGVYLLARKDGRQIFLTGHSEYAPLTLKAEYDRDISRGLDIAVPTNYFPGDDPTRPPNVTWRGHANLLFMNWLNYYVYQETPYNLEELR